MHTDTEKIMAESGRTELTRRQFGRATLALGAAAALPGWLLAQEKNAPAALENVTGPNSLRAHAAARGLLYGTAVDPELLDVDGVAAGNAVNGYTLLIQQQAGILVAENAMKWEGLRPGPSIFDFSQADKMMRFAALAGQRVRGHNLCWHEALPSWFKSTVNQANARTHLIQHIQTVAGHYRGQIHSWDVVNEAIEPKDGRADSLRKTPWLELIGPDYLDLAFRTAAEADPHTRLTYNDYGIELDTPEQTRKREAVLELVRGFKARSVPIHAVGVQSHIQADGPQPGAGLKSFIREAAKMSLEVYVTEMDVNTHSLAGGPDAQDAAVAQIYRDYLTLVLAEPNVPIVLTWGITDAHCWLNEMNEPWAKRPDGAKQRPLPFDENLKPAPAFLALRAALDSAPPRLRRWTRPL
jgi:endo-1,4-beta-xylanase